MKARYKSGTRASVKAADAYAELERIRIAHGGTLHPADVVAESAPEDAVLHSEFEWDDTAAAAAHRSAQARYIIRHIEVVRAEAPHTHSRAYEATVVHVPGGSTGEDVTQHVYRDTAAILRDPITRKALLDRARADMQQFKSRYSALTELSAVINAMQEALPLAAG